MKIILLVVLILLLNGCKNKVYVEVKEFVGQKVEIPTTLESRILDRDTTLTTSSSKPCLVVYYNFQGCSSCKLKELLEWKLLLADLDSLKKNNFKIHFIMNVGNQMNKTTVDLLSYDFKYPVYFDMRGDFERLNKLPKDPIFHTFLLDEDNKVILVGSPIYNDKMWKLYKKTIDSLINSRKNYY